MKRVESAALRRLGTSHIDYDDDDSVAYIYDMDNKLVANLGSVDMQLLARDMMDVTRRLYPHIIDDDTQEKGEQQ